MHYNKTMPKEVILSSRSNYAFFIIFGLFLTWILSIFWNDIQYFFYASEGDVILSHNSFFLVVVPFLFFVYFSVILILRLIRHFYPKFSIHFDSNKSIVSIVILFLFSLFFIILAIDTYTKIDSEGIHYNGYIDYKEYWHTQWHEVENIELSYKVGFDQNGDYYRFFPMLKVHSSNSQFPIVLWDKVGRGTPAIHELELILDLADQNGVEIEVNFLDDKAEEALSKYSKDETFLIRGIFIYAKRFIDEDEDPTDFYNDITVVDTEVIQVGLEDINLEAVKESHSKEAIFRYGKWLEPGSTEYYYELGFDEWRLAKWKKMDGLHFGEISKSP